MDSAMRRKMLIVDDIQLNRLILSDLFADQYDVIEADNGLVALDLINQYGPELSIILLDIVMPIMDGFSVLEHLRKNQLMDSVPVILITGEQDDELILQGYSMGVADLINKPFNPEIVDRRVSNVVGLYSSKQELEHRLLEQKEMLLEQSEQLRQSTLFVIDALSTSVEFRSMESGTHVKRIRLLTKALLEAMVDDYPLSAETIETISNSSALHDIGKIAIPDAILNKPGKLTAEEFEVMKTHTVRGCEILSSLNYTDETGVFKYGYDICRHHHERWDGRGYPDGLKGEEIPIWAQAASLADVYDALTSPRVYKSAFSHQQSMSMILKGECGQFNPKMLNAFINVADKLRNLAQLQDPGDSVKLAVAMAK